MAAQLLFAVLTLLSCLGSEAFLVDPSSVRSLVVDSSGSSFAKRPSKASKLFLARTPDPNDRLFQDFKTANGEILNPYQVLRVPKTATTSEIRQSYIKFSRKYHPDGVRHKDILPGSCNNLDDVRDEWERIRLSYEILKTPKLRKRYDRHEVLNDPGAAVRRAAADAAWSGVKGIATGVGKGLWNVASFAVQQASSTINTNATKTTN